MTRAFGSWSEEDVEKPSPAAVSPEEQADEDFWFDVRQSVAGRPDFDMSGYPIEEGSLLREPGEAQMRLVVDNAHKFDKTPSRKREGR